MPDQKILVVDDEEEMLGLIEKALKQEGYDVEAVTTGKDALHKARTGSPDLILIDIVLPDMEGPEVIRALLNDSTTRNIPAVFLSGIVTRERDSEAATEVRVSDRLYSALSKPFSSAELMTEVRKALS